MDPHHRGPAESPPVGSYIGPYRIVAPLGAGGMGEVYRAHDAKLARDVALKLLPRDLVHDAVRRARMVREAQAAASLNHPNICTIYEVGEAEGRPFIAMEVIEGESLGATLARGRLSLPETLRIGLQLAEAVGHAHDRGIVHRDLKGGNIMISPEGRVKVLDFGLAKRLGGQELTEATTNGAAPITQPLAILGTLPYMAPEQLRGQPADTRSDVWALGVVLHEMAAGTRPFDGDTGFELSSAILREAPSPLPVDVAPSLRAAIARCLEKEPARRYQRAGELRAALEAVRDGSAVAAPAAHATYRPWTRAAAAAVALVAIGALMWTMAQWRTPGPAGQSGVRIRSIAVLPLENRSGDPGEEYFVAGIHEALITDLARLGIGKVIAKPSAEAFKGGKKPLRDIATELGVEGLVTGSVVRSSNRVQIAAQLVDADDGAVVWANRYERDAGDVLSLQNEVVSAIARELRATLTPEQSARLASAVPINAAAHDAYLKGRSIFAAFTASPFDLELLDAARAQFERTIAIDPNYAPPYATLSVMYLVASQTSLRPPKDTFPFAKTAAVKAVQLDDQLSDAHAALAEVYMWYDWDWAGAAREIRRALELNPDSPDALRASETYATLVAGKYDEAARTSERILSLDPLNPFSRVQLSWVAFFSRRHDESIRFATTVTDIWPNNLMGPVLLASNYAAKRLKPEVIEHCGKVMDILRGNYVMQMMAVCAWAYAAVKEPDRARRLLQVLERPPAGVWLDPAVMGSVYGELGDIDRAMASFQQGLEQRSPNMIYMKSAAMWDAVRGDRRFQAMLRGMNFPQ